MSGLDEDLSEELKLDKEDNFENVDENTKKVIKDTLYALNDEINIETIEKQIINLFDDKFSTQFKEKYLLNNNDSQFLKEKINKKQKGGSNIISSLNEIVINLGINKTLFETMEKYGYTFQELDLNFPYEMKIDENILLLPYLENIEFEENLNLEANADEEKLYIGKDQIDIDNKKQGQLLIRLLGFLILAKNLIKQIVFNIDVSIDLAKINNDNYTETSKDVEELVKLNAKLISAISKLCKIKIDDLQKIYTIIVTDYTYDEINKNTSEIINLLDEIKYKIYDENKVIFTNEVIKIEDFIETLYNENVTKINLDNMYEDFFGIDKFLQIPTDDSLNEEVFNSLKKNKNKNKIRDELFGIDVKNLIVKKKYTSDQNKLIEIMNIFDFIKVFKNEDFFIRRDYNKNV